MQWRSPEDHGDYMDILITLLLDIISQQNAEEEEIPVPNLHFYDNKAAVDQLMSKPEGLTYVIDEATRNGGTAFLIESIQNSTKGPHITANSSREFAVAHYTGKVTYDATEMPDKNRDFLPPEMIETMRLSSREIVSQLFSGLFTKTGNLTTRSDPTITAKKIGRWRTALVAENEIRKSRSHNTISKGQYSQSRQMRTSSAVYRGTCLEVLKSLTLSGCGVHFVRCLRADLTDKPWGFQADVVRQQLRALAVIDTAKARQRGYSHIVPFTEFIRRYKFLAFDFDENVEFTKENCRLLLIRLKMEGWAIGKTKVFLKYYNQEYLSRLYETQVKKIVKVQSMMRAFIAKRSLCSKIKQIQENPGNFSFHSFESQESEEGSENEPVVPQENEDEGAGNKSTEEETDKKRDAKKKERDLSEVEAAIIIQKGYRGHMVRKQCGQTSTITGALGDSTTFIRDYCKKWRSKSIFQVLLLYRAKRHQDLVYFSQQSHLYNQYFISCLQEVNSQISLQEVNIKAQAKTYLPSYRPFVHKLPFRFEDFQFFDNNYMCDPIQGKGFRSPTNDEETWDAPLLRHVPEKYKTPRLPEKRIEKVSLRETPFIRESSRPVPVVRFNKPSNIVKVKDERIRQPEKLPAPQNQQGDQVSGDSPYRLPLSVKRPQNIKNPIKELEEKCKKVETASNEDDPPFNFQAMLRKTNHSRSSFKKRNENVVYSSDFQSNFRSVLKKSGQQKLNTLKRSGDIVITELVPGLVVQGEVAEL